MEHGGAPSHRLGDAPHQWRLLRAGEQPLAEALRCGVDAGTDVVEQMRRVLDLVKDHRQREVVQEALRVGLGAGHHVRILEQHRRGARKPLPKQRRLAGTTRPRQDDGREVPGRQSEACAKSPPEILHDDKSKSMP